MRFLPPWRLIAAFAIGIVLMLGFRAYQDSGPSVIINSVVVADDTVESGTSGDTISFVVDLERERMCPATVSRFVWHWADWRGQKLKDFHSIDNPPLSPMPGEGEQKYMITLHIQGGFPPGPWFERTVTQPSCSLISWPRFRSNRPQIEDRPIKIEALK